jgi:hypothetical protein
MSSKDVDVFDLKKLLVAGLAVGALTLSGCGTQPADTAKKPDVLELLRTDAKGSLQTAAEQSQKTKSASVTFDGTVAGKPFTGKGQISFDTPLKADMVMKAAGQEITVRLIDTIQYIQVPEAQKAQLQGKSWMKIDLTEAAKLSGMDANQFGDQMRNMDPGKQVKAMLENGKLKVVGEETVDGAKTVHYTSDLTVAQYLDAYASDAKSRTALKDALAKAGVKDNIKTDLWVDEKYQMRKAHITMGSMMDVSYTYTDYGKPVEVVAPPESETVDMLEMLKGLKKPAA